MAAASASKRELLELLEHLEPAALARLASLGVAQGTSTLSLHGGQGDAAPADVLPLDWPELEKVLPDHGLARGVTEIASPITKHGAMRGGATTIALSAIRAAHAADPRAWCAWITEEGASPLYAPAVAQAGVDLDRLLVVRPSAADLARTVVKTAASGAFDVIVIDAPHGLDGRLAIPIPAPGHERGAGKRTSHGPRASRVDGSVVIRKLALAGEEKGTSSIVLTNLFTARAVPWPVALRLEVERRPESIAVRVTKDRRGRSSSQHVVRLAS
ncbi:MAG: hypothetical protein JWP97_2038 [Labilithrix sp.]|nr:hypothetical protein [Labilithrix sp.]